MRDYRDQVSDPHLLQEIKDFIRQEGSTASFTTSSTNTSRRRASMWTGRGADSRFLFGIMRKYMPKAHTLAATAACEHLTAIMAETLFERKDIMGEADPRMFALYAWHAMEEMEHKAVAFDVMQKVAKVGYLRRIWTQIEVTLSFNLQILLFAGYMPSTTAFRSGNAQSCLPKAWWVYGPKGLFSSSWRSYLSYYRPGFHPWQDGGTASYPVWLETMNRTSDPIAAGRAVLAAAH